jgi:hypothetical protein
VFSDQSKRKKLISNQDEKSSTEEIKEPEDVPRRLDAAAAHGCMVATPPQLPSSLPSPHTKPTMTSMNFLVSSFLILISFSHHQILFFMLTFILYTGQFSVIYGAAIPAVMILNETD